MSDHSQSDHNQVLNPTVVRLGLVSLFADISSEMLYPITPIFLTVVLGASMASLGLVEGCAETVASLLKTFSGSWSDRSGRRKPFVVVGYLIAALAKPLIGVSANWVEVLLARSLDRTGKGLRGGPRDALLSESVSAERRGAAFGWHRAMDTLGAAIGPLMAVVYLQHFKDDLRGIFLWAVIPGLVAVAFALTVREPAAKPRTSKTAKKLRLTLKGLAPEFRRYLVTWGIFSLANSSDVFLLLRAKQAGASLTATILMYCFYNLVYALASPWLGGLSDKFGRKPVLISGFVIFAGVYAAFACVEAAAWHWLLFGVYGLYMAATDGVGKAFAVDLVPPEEKATGVGLLGTVTGIGALVASLSAGFLWDHCGPPAAFLFGAAGALIAASSLGLIRVKKSYSYG